MSTEKPSKRELTRKKVILAAIDCIYSEGFNAAHTNKIAEKAGVSWGVLQYHFGDKDGLLQAVIDHIFDEFSSTLSSAEYLSDSENQAETKALLSRDNSTGSEIPQSSLHRRVRQLIDTVWSLVNKKEYRVSVAILRNAGRSPDSSIDGQKQLSDWAQKTSQLWDRLFEPDSPKPAHSDTARRLVFASLRGLVDEINPQGITTKKSVEAECAALADAINYLLEK